VKLRWGKHQTAHATCNLDRKKKQFNLLIDPTTHPAQWLDLLIHEYAHALSWTHASDAKDTRWPDHGPLWGVAYARVYQVVSGDK
jgi:hypothetical protein